MSYEIYRKVLSISDYFNSWNENTHDLSKDLKEHIYNKYVIKCKVFNRDNFKCVNVNCTTPNSELTMHHVKFQKNGGKHKVDNCITLCKNCHKKFHNGSKELTVVKNNSLPYTVSGKTFKLNQSNDIDWKKILKEMKQLRKNVKHECGIEIPYDLMKLLMKWLTVRYDEFDN